MPTLIRIDPDRNMARYWTAHLEPTLFGETSVVRAWGRIGARRGRTKMTTFSEVPAAVEALERLIVAKRRRGYAPDDPASIRHHS